ncbi:cytochrome P450 [Streptomyces sp. NPDC101062]|uniref:cytochrome P450 n=1 Tax=unclassified Streptomyces TaxID=2593676 RepID=UPI003817F480
MSIRPHLYTLYTEDFAQQRHAYYASMREHYGHVAPVEIAPGAHGYLVISPEAARTVQHDTDTWTRNPSVWASRQPADSPVLGMLGYRPNPLFTDGAEHDRYRRVVTDVLSWVEPHFLRDAARQVADGLIDQMIEKMATDGAVDLVRDFTSPFPSILLNRLFGQDDSRAEKLVRALERLMDAGPDGAAANAEFEQYITELIASKRAHPSRDITTLIIQHPAQLSEEEVLHALTLLVAAGKEPSTHLMGNTFYELATDNALYSQAVNGAIDLMPAIEQALTNRPPMANYGAHYPRRAVTLYGQPIAAHSLVLVSFEAVGISLRAAASGCPRSGGKQHIAWSHGPHTCPASDIATTMAVTALTQAIQRLPDLELTVPAAELRLRTGPFQHALAALPARFAPVTVTTRGEYSWDFNPFMTSTPSTRTDATSPASPPNCDGWETWLPSNSPAA